MLRDLGRQISRHPLVRRTESTVNTSDFRYDRERDLLEVGDFIREIPSEPGALSRASFHIRHHPSFT